MATIRTVYEVSKPAQQFYSVERAGYTSFDTATAQIVNDMLQIGAFRFANITYSSSQVNSELFPSPWPLVERIWELDFGGSGYNKGEVLQAVGGTYKTPFTFKVLDTKFETRNGVEYGGVIGNISITTMGQYEPTIESDGTVTSFAIPGPSDGIQVIYANSKAFTANTITFLGNLTASWGNINIPVPAPSLNQDTYFTTSTWQGAFGLKDGTALPFDGGGGTVGTKWPTVGAWIFKTTYDIDKDKIFIGSLVELESGSITSLIPPDTYVTGIYLLNGKIITGVKTDAVLGTYPEQANQQAVYFTFSNQVTINKGDKLRFLGRTATLKNTKLQTPDDWMVTLEGTGAVDPLSDSVGVFGNVSANITAGNLIQITNITTPNNYNPVIYPGQTVAQPPTLIGEPFTQQGVLVTDVENYTETVNGTKVFKANVKLNQNVTVAEGKPLRFWFPSPQPWRVAFHVQRNSPYPVAGSQTLVAYAGTELQLPNTGGVAKVINSAGVHVDYAGLMGNVWTNQPEIRIPTTKITGTVATTSTTGSIVLDFKNQQFPPFAVGSTITVANVSVPPYNDSFTVTSCNIGNVTVSTTKTTLGTVTVPASAASGIVGNITGLQAWENITSAFGINKSKGEQGFYNRETRIKDSPNNFPLNYNLTITNRGVFLGMWEGNWSTVQKVNFDTNKDNFFNWFLIQRAVNRTTGRVTTTGRCPVFCLNGVGFKYWKFIVREEDVLHTTSGPEDSEYQFTFANARSKIGGETVTTVKTPYRTPADYHTIDNFAVLNTANQLSLTEDSKYLVSFITNLTTPRFRYSDELDMIGQTSADVVGHGVELPITPYGQTLPSTYRALPANNKYNTGMRICVIKDIPNN